MGQKVYDLAIIGGGINGCGIARDAAGRGLSVALFEKADLASGTSSASTKLIHGGLRYLEHFEFRLVWEALKEREVLWAQAPHIIWPLRFVLPHHPGLRPFWLLRLGLFLYDHLGGRRLLPPTRVLDLSRDPAGAPLRPGLERGLEYSDCGVDDARLVILNASDAADRGARVETRAKVVGAIREGGLWRVEVERSGGREEVRARILVNAAGPWVADVLGTLGVGAGDGVRLVQGSHIVVRRLFEHDRCYIFQNADGRIDFVIPYARDFTLIGTTDRDYAGRVEDVRASAEEVDYLCRAVSAYLKAPVTPADVVWRYSGVRALHDDGAAGARKTRAQEATRDYVLALDEAGAPLLSVFGGKITTYRRLAEHALENLSRHLPSAGGPWTARVPLPGGDFPVTGFEALVDGLSKDYPAFDPAFLARLARSYGTLARTLLGDARIPADLGPLFGADLSAREVDFLMDTEWAQSAEDVLWRRSKLGLRLSSSEAATLEDYMVVRRSIQAATG